MTELSDSILGNRGIQSFVIKREVKAHAKHERKLKVAVNLPINAVVKPQRKTTNTRSQIATRSSARRKDNAPYEDAHMDSDLADKAGAERP